jgi:hypothetical protein
MWATATLSLCAFFSAFFSASNVRFAVVLLPAQRSCAQLAHTALVSQALSLKDARFNDRPTESRAWVP